MADFTKGEWRAEGNTIEVDGFAVAVAYDPDNYSIRTPISLANARLIAAAVNACQKVNPDNPLRESHLAELRRRRIMDMKAWIEESQRRGEDVVVIIRNKATGEEVETTANPTFIEGVSKIKEEK